MQLGVGTSKSIYCIGLILLEIRGHPEEKQLFERTCHPQRRPGRIVDVELEAINRPKP